MCRAEESSDSPLHGYKAVDDSQSDEDIESD